MSKSNVTITVALAAGALSAVAVALTPLVFWMFMPAESGAELDGATVLVLGVLVLLGLNFGGKAAIPAGVVAAVLTRIGLSPGATIRTTVLGSVLTSFVLLGPILSDESSEEVGHSDPRTLVQDHDLLDAFQGGVGGDTPQQRKALRKAARELAIERLSQGHFFPLEGVALRSAVLAAFMPSPDIRPASDELKPVAVRQLVAQNEFVALVEQAPDVAFDLLVQKSNQFSLEGLDEAASAAVTASAIERMNEDGQSGWRARRIAVLGRLHTGGSGAVEAVAMDVLVTQARRYEDWDLGPVVAAAALATDAPLDDDTILLLTQLSILPLLVDGGHYVGRQSLPARQLLKQHSTLLIHRLSVEKLALLAAAGWRAWCPAVNKAMSRGLLEPEDARILLEGLENATARNKKKTSEPSQLLATQAALTKLASHHDTAQQTR